jgi:hypothetical protein
MKKRWVRMPLPDLVQALNDVTNDGVLRADAEVPTALADRVEVNELFYEVQL